MLAAATLGLIVPAFDMVEGWSNWIVVVGVMGGALFLNVLDYVTPHLHQITGLDPETHANNSTINHILLFVMAIAIHKLPEGMAAGVSMNDMGSGETSWSVTFGIALQNVPEGMVVIAPLLLAGVSKIRTFLISLAIGLLEIVFACHRSARNHGSLDWLRFGCRLRSISPSNARICRWSHALRDIGRDDSRNPCAWLSETSDLRTGSRICNADSARKNNLGK